MEKKPAYLDESLSFEERAKDLVSRMTLEEKSDTNAAQFTRHTETRDTGIQLVERSTPRSGEGRCSHRIPTSHRNSSHL